MNFVVSAHAELWQSGTHLATFMVDPSSNFTADRNNSSRRVCSLTLTDGVLTFPAGQSVVPGVQNDLFAPLGNEVILYYTMVYEDGSTEDIPEGVYGIDDLDIDNTGKDLVITLTGSDRAAEVIASGFINTYGIPPNTNVALAIQLLMQQAIVGFPWQFNFAPTSAITPATPLIYTPTTDPFTEGQLIARAIGFDLYFDPIGVSSFLPIPDPKLGLAEPSWTYDGSPGGTANIMDELKRKLSRTATNNYIIRDGVGAGIATPIRAIAQDLDPSSRTYVLGPYGRRRDYKASNLYAVQWQAQAAADADLALSLGALEAIEVRAIPKPDTDIDDVISVTDPRAGVSAAAIVIDSFTMGFGNAGVTDMIGRTVSTS